MGRSFKVLCGALIFSALMLTAWAGVTDLGFMVIYLFGIVTCAIFLLSIILRFWGHFLWVESVTLLVRGMLYWIAFLLLPNRATKGKDFEDFVVRMARSSVSLFREFATEAERR